ncbi:AAA family ATPase [Paenibacillus sp. KACC 21273]|uniref:AAA family ATPase n=1 Tax=Paenibacillus sp. KACC 21273 TaxID=3025665 RepID=UPI0023665CAE|nr:AAA family ATPase [Paenibacillus sp. KACC 21273]WDF49130.1 AAA family ATPase [Paenibacillus sp. KACC 21273]
MIHKKSLENNILYGIEKIENANDLIYLQEVCEYLSDEASTLSLIFDLSEEANGQYLTLYKEGYKKFLDFFSVIDNSLIINNTIRLKFNKHEILIDQFSDLYDKYVSKDAKYLITEFINMSTGEEDIINLFSVIYYAINLKDIVDKENIVILLDEPNNFMHPEWNRKLIFMLLEFLKDISKESKQKYTIICTTHSPFLLSDLYTEQVIALNTNKEKKVEIKLNLEKTFASNIHTLFSDNFFMESTVGEFAKQKINFIITRLNEALLSEDKKLLDKEKQAFKYVIERIGEPLIAMKLNEMYMGAVEHDEELNNNLIEKNIKLTEHIKKLEDRLRKLDDNDSNL